MLGIRAVDLAVLVGGWLVGNVVLNAFEQHVPWYRRLMKLLAIVALFLLVGFLGGRIAFYFLLAVIAGGDRSASRMVVSQAWYQRPHGRAAGSVP